MLALAPIELIVLIGAFLQELISPLPSFVLFVPAGAGLEAQGASVWYIAGLAFIVGIMRVLAGLILYWLSDKLRTKIYATKGSWLGTRKQSLEHIRTKLGRQGSWWAVIWLWALPFVPGTLISLASGFVKIPKPTFITATYFGSIINALTYLLIGYYGLHVAGLLI